MADQWHYSRNSEQHGPVSAARLKELATSGELAPTDLVWKEGMAEWKPAKSIKGLFPNPTPSASAPPPLPPPTEPPSAQQETWQPLGDRLTGLVGVSLQLWRENRLKFFGIGLLVLSIMMCGLNPLMDSDVGIVNFVGGLCLLLWLGFLLGFVITGATRGWRWLDERTELDSRKGKLRSKWDSVNGDAEWIVFFDDGGFLRGDGFSAKYEFDPKADIITIRAMQLDEVIPVQVVSLSNHELVLATDGLTLHYRKGKSITDVERQKALEEYSRKWGERAKTAAAVVGTAVGVAALGVLVLGGAAAAAGSVGTSGGITPSGSKVCWNCSHYFDARRPTCSNCGVVNR